MKTYKKDDKKIISGLEFTFNGDSTWLALGGKIEIEELDSSFLATADSLWYGEADTEEAALKNMFDQMAPQLEVGAEIYKAFRSAQA